MMLAPKVAIARAAGALSRRSGRGGGTSLPGRVLLALEPAAIGELSRGLARGSVAISATNGKTTTAAMAAEMLARAGVATVHNRAGANMAGGVATALLSGRGELGLFELDEMWLAQVSAQLSPRVIVLGNLFRDQLDRYGELESIAERWEELVGGSSARLAVNADDPLLADIARGASDVVWFGVEDPGVALAGMAHASDSKHCRVCGAPYRYERVYLGHLGIYACPNGHPGRPAPSVSAQEIRLEGVRAASFELRTPVGSARVALPLPGLYNVYNALAAAALGVALELPFEAIRGGLEGVAPAFGRAETVRSGGRELAILLVKNPAGANEVLRTLGLEEGEHDVLGVLNDNIADGRDVSWIWDADFETLAPRLRHVVCAGTRAEELAVRLKYAGVPVSRLLVEPALGPALEAAIRSDGGGTLYALPTYTAMLELRELLVARGEAASSWEAA
jgi:UDP-N-acetylmuramyl tripeptide synthase